MANYSIFIGFSQQTKARLYDNLPKKPYCTNNLNHGLKIKSKASAFTHAYLQVNTPWATRYITFDVDKEWAVFAWEAAHLPVPTFIVLNKDNGFGHLVYELHVPVYRWGNAHRKPIEWLNAIIRAFTLALEADAGYNGLICKNPNHEKWSVRDFNSRYELVELSESVDLQQKHYTPPKGYRTDFAGAGRNNYLFEVGRHWAYLIVQQCSNQDDLQQRVHTHLENVNFTEFTPEPPDRVATYIPDVDTTAFERGASPPNELRHTAKSIAGWTWNHRDNITGQGKNRRRKTKDDAELKQRQIQSAYSTAEVKRAATEAKIQKAIDKLLREGRRVTKTAIAKEVGISRQAVHQYYSHLLQKV